LKNAQALGAAQAKLEQNEKEARDAEKIENVKPLGDADSDERLRGGTF
jgi:hypothetical protein